MRGPLIERLEERAASGRPLRVCLVGAGTFGTMLLAQLRRLRGIELAGVADHTSGRAAHALAVAGWPDSVTTAADAADLIGTAGADVVVEATGDPLAGADHALAGFAAGSHVVMVTVETDALCGPVLAERAREAGVVYGLAYGDQPALICELVEWAQACGFDVVCAGKGTRHVPEFHRSTPATVWEHYGIPAEDAAARGFDPRMFNSFVDGTKSAIEMAAVANATGLRPQPDGLRFPPCGTGELAQICIPETAGGALSSSGTVEVVSSLERSGEPVPNDLRWGVFVTFEAPTDYVRDCFAAYGLATDPSGRFAALYRPFHLIGLETPVSVLAAGLSGEATGVPRSHEADVVATAKRDLHPGETLDGEGGETVYGRLARTNESVSRAALPIGLARGLRITRAVPEGGVVRYDDAEPPPASAALEARRELELRLTRQAPRAGSRPPTR